MSNAPAEYVKAAAAAALAGAGSYLREPPASANLTADYAALPLIVMGDYTATQARADSRTSGALLTLYFADARPGQHDDPVAHYAAVGRMDALKQRFLAALDAYPLAQVDGIKATPFASAYAAELDGVGVQLTLTVPAAPLLVACVDAPAVPLPPPPAHALQVEDGLYLLTEE